MTELSVRYRFLFSQMTNKSSHTEGRHCKHFQLSVLCVATMIMPVPQSIQMSRQPLSDRSDGTALQQHSLLNVAAQVFRVRQEE